MDIRVVLIEPEHQGNIGLIARVMKNFGYTDLWLVNPKIKLGFEATALASHAKDLLSVAKISMRLGDAIKDCNYIIATTAIVGRSPSNLDRQSMELKEFAEKASDMKGKAALLFGRESNGLTNEEIAQCDLVITIPTDNNYRTLNIAIAVAITLYELHTIKKSSVIGYEQASKESRQMLLTMFEKLAIKVCLPRHRIPLIKRAFGNVISRSMISKREASLMAGVLRRASEKIGCTSKTKK